ncbi:tetratricopeptide repeat protein [Saccharothrix saharensis]|uniref:Tetratricopeptide repeat protein n=1 Tax=Saccharothrix saharensis TaxID=571190 RepID=A0A543J5W1_9PSEU|nr:tetratricopeptide repeat protein [Saccharothrix saharensis]TQM78187.1 tetratricopeptide repeat protein [Saccharothrix saharensis]
MDEPRHAVARLLGELRTISRTTVGRGDETGHTWFGAHRDHLSATLRDSLTEPEPAVALFAEVWPVVPVEVNEAWARDLLDAGAELAAVLPTSLLLATGFRRAAASLRLRGALRLAAVAGMRELAIHRLRDDDPDTAAAALGDLAATYRAQGRLHKVVGCADEALELYLLHDDRPGTAAALVHLGALMLEVSRHDSAVKYLSRADKLFTELDDPAGRAACLPELGRALWLSGNRAEAYRRFNRAIGLLIGTGGDATRSVRDRIRELEEGDRAATDDPSHPGGAGGGTRQPRTW